MKQYHALKVGAKTGEAKDALRIAIDVPEGLRDTFAFAPGQHLPLEVTLDGESVRRTYSICTPPGQWPLEIGVRVQPGGAFSGYASATLKAGDTLNVMPPFGRFHLEPADGPRTVLAFAAGSGITPILSIVATVLRDEPDSQVAVFYGNRQQSTTMFIDDLYALKNRYPERLTLQFVFSREDQEFPLAAGRLDTAKVAELFTAFCRGKTPDEAFVCGPDTMIDNVREALIEQGMPASAVHTERFGAPRKATGPSSDAVPAQEAARVTVVMDGHRKHFDMPTDRENIVDAAATHGIELPYSCKGGVCATCRCHVRSGEVVMATNYGLEPWEVEAGFVLACQSRPLTPELVLDYDKT